jgi:class 3 adenylate cyclase
MGAGHYLQPSTTDSSPAASFAGRIVKTTGDGMLVEFASVVDAVRCAVAVQQVMAERNIGVDADKRIELRIGINLGDVIVEGDDHYATITADAPLGRARGSASASISGT